MKKSKFLVVTALLIFIAGCGGGGGGGGTSSNADTPITTKVAVTVIDGPIKNATVCLDKNLNGSCDANEPTGTTDVNGLVNLNVDNADVGKYPVIAVVDTNAVDADTGAVANRYVMKAPADAAAVVSPLTTLVQVQVETFSLTTAQATEAVASSTGLTAAQLTADYTKDTSSAGSTAYSIAQAMVVAFQKQSAAAQSAVGTAALDGGTITQANFDKAVANAAANMLAAILSEIASSGTVTSAATPKERLAALQSLFTSDFLKNNGGMTSAAGAQVAVGIQNAAASQASTTTTYTPAAGASLGNLEYTDATHWYARISQKTLTEATLDANNAYKYRWARYKNSGGGEVAWGGLGGSPARGADLHWNGSGWVSCLINHQNTQTATDSKGIANYNYCDSYSTGTVNTKAPTSASFDVSQQMMNGVYLDKIVAANFTNIKIGDGSVSKANALLGAAVFPAGSWITYTTDSGGKSAVSYYPSSGNPGYDNTVVLSSLVDSVGGDFTSGNPQSVCGPTVFNAASNFEDLIARNVGTPCKFAKATVTGQNGVTLSSTEGGQTRNENWSWTTLSLGTIGSATVPGTADAASTHYTGNTALRVAFAANSVANYYSCKQRYDSGPRNCDLVASGKYTINTLSDGSRSLTFAGLPPIAASMGWERVLVERNNLVYWGYQNLPTTSVSARLNKTALNALFAQLGLNTVSYFNGLIGGFDPASTITLNRLAYAGNYRGVIKATGYSNGSFSATVGLDGRNTCTGTNPFVSPATSGVAFNCTVTLTPGVSDSTYANLVIRTSDNTTVLSGSLNYYTGVISSGTWSRTSGGVTSTGTATGSRL